MIFKWAVTRKCWRPKDYPKMLPDFETFAGLHALITSSGTFNKQVCGCPTQDECDESRANRTL